MSDALEVTAPERIWLESTTNSHLSDPGLTFTAPAWQWIECEANSPRAFQYVLASKADAQADELRAEVERLRVENARFLNAIETANYGIEELVLGGDEESPAPLIADDVWAVTSCLRTTLKRVDGGCDAQAEQEGDEARPAEDFDLALQEGIRRMAESEGWPEASAADCLAQLERMAGAEFPNARAALTKALEKPTDAEQEGDNE